MYFKQKYNFVIRIPGGNLPSSKLKGDSGIESPSLPAAVPHIWAALLLLQSLLAPFATCIFVAPELKYQGRVHTDPCQGYLDLKKAHA